MNVRRPYQIIIKIRFIIISHSSQLFVMHRNTPTKKNLNINEYTCEFESG